MPDSLHHLTRARMWLQDTADLDDPGDYNAYHIFLGMIDKEIKEAEEIEEKLQKGRDEYPYSNEEVHTIASGYEWECPICGEFHAEIEVRDVLTRIDWPGDYPRFVEGYRTKCYSQHGP